MMALYRSTRVALCAFAVLGTAACSQAGLHKHYTEMRPAMVRGDWETAAAQMEKAKESPYGEKDRVMYWLNLGTVLHYANKPDASNEHLVKAEAAMQELWTESVSAEASKVLLNETVQSYPGEDFEKVLVYVYTSLNNVKLGKVQDAIVEARRADELLKKMLVHFEKEGEVGSVYKQDAFVLWLIGLYYELEGGTGLSDSLILYKAAYEAYQTDYAGQFGSPAPSYLGEDIVRVATLQGVTDEAQKFQQSTGATGETVQKLAEMGEVIVIHGNGESPSKRELRFDGVMPDGYVMSIAVPEFVTIQPRVAYCEISANGVTAKSELAEPINEIVLKNFELRLPAIKTRAIARAVVKYAASKGAQAAAGGDSAAGQLIGLAANVAAVVSEAADLRSWTTLPHSFRVARMWLPPGQHNVDVSFNEASGVPVGQKVTIPVTVEAGKRQIISVRSVL
jgi:uncharacterized protein